jgi:hypothetical protein
VVAIIMNLPVFDPKCFFRLQLSLMLLLTKDQAILIASNPKEHKPS